MEAMARSAALLVYGQTRSHLSEISSANELVAGRGCLPLAWCTGAVIMLRKLISAVRAIGRRRSPQGVHPIQMWRHCLRRDLLWPLLDALELGLLKMSRTQPMARWGDGLLVTALLVADPFLNPIPLFQLPDQRLGRLGIVFLQQPDLQPVSRAHIHHHHHVLTVGMARGRQSLAGAVNARHPHRPSSPLRQSLRRRPCRLSIAGDRRPRAPPHGSPRRPSPHN